MAININYEEAPSVGDEKYLSGGVVMKYDGEKYISEDSNLKLFLKSQGLSGNYGYFSDGFTYKNVGDVGISEDGVLWEYNGEGYPNKIVTQGTDPYNNNSYKIYNFNSIRTNFETIEELVSYKFFVKGMKVKTSGYYEPLDGGGATYEIIDNFVACNEIDFDLHDGLVAKLLPTSDGYILEEMGCLGNIDISSRLITALEREYEIKSRSSNAVYILNKEVRVENKSINIDFNNSKILHTDLANERCFLLINNFHETHNILNVGFSLGRTTFTVPAGHGIQARDKIKAFSNQTINIYSEFPNQRAAEYFYVDSVTETTIVCIGKHVWRYDPLDNPRLAKMRENSCDIRNLIIDRELQHLPNEFSVAIGVTGYFQPEFRNIHGEAFTGQLLSVRSCYRAKGFDISATYLKDDDANAALGYVAVDYGSQESEWHGLNGGKVRHTYTTGANSIDADHPNTTLYGGAVRCHVYSGVTHGSTNFAYDTHQDAWGCEFHDITVYDDYSTTESASGAFQDRGQNTVVHKLTHISEGENSSGGEVSVLFTTGARNTYIKEIVFRGRGTILSAFALGIPNTEFEQSYRIDKITAYQPKFAPRIARMNFPFTLNIGEINIYPFDNERTFYGSGGIPLFSLNDKDANLQVENLNLYFNSRALVPSDPSGDMICNLDGDFGKLRINVNTYTNSNTYTKFEQNLAGLRSSATDVPYQVEDSIINWTAYIDDWNDSMKKNARFYTEGEVEGNLKFSYKVIGDGIERPSSSMSSTITIFEENMLLRTFDPTQFSLTSSIGKQLDRNIDLFVVSTSSNSSISEITPPTFVGQRVNIVNIPWNESGLYLPFTIVSGCLNSDLSQDKIVNKGDMFSMVSYMLGENLVWHIPN